MIFGLLFNKVISIWKLKKKKKKKKKCYSIPQKWTNLQKNAQIDICLPKTQNDQNSKKCHNTIFSTENEIS